MSSHYLETSAILAIAFERDTRLAKALAERSNWVTSSLTPVEVERRIIRARLSGVVSSSTIDAAYRLTSRCTLIELSDEVLERAKQPFKVEPVRSLDAIHLATLAVLSHRLHWLTVVNCDRRIRDNALAENWGLLPTDFKETK